MLSHHALKYWQINILPSTSTTISLEHIFQRFQINALMHGMLIQSQQQLAMFLDTAFSLANDKFLIQLANNLKILKLFHAQTEV